MYSWDLQTFYTGKLSVESTEHRVRQGSYTERVWFMGGNPIGHLWGLSEVSNLSVEDSVLRITSNDKVVKRVFVTVMGMSIKVLNLCHAFTSGWGEEKGKVVG